MMKNTAKTRRRRAWRRFRSCIGSFKQEDTLDRSLPTAVLQADKHDPLRLRISPVLLLCLFCVLLSGILLAGGCGAGQPGPRPDPIANVEADLPPLRLESAELRPIIFKGELSGTRYPLKEGAILAVANGFSLDLLFSDTLDPEQIPSAIQLSGPAEASFSAVRQEASVTNGDRIINVFVPEIQPGDYILTVSAGLTGKKSSALEEAVALSLQLDCQTEGEFFLLDSSGLPRPISYDECRYGLSLSDTAKTFIIHFNQDVNQASVQDSILNGLREQPVLTAFSWLTPQQLRINMTQLQTGMSYYLILDRSIDNKGNGILGSCIFRVGKASNIGVIQLASNEMTMIYQFSEERYYGIRSQIINNRTLLQAGSSLTWSFGLSARQLFSLPFLRYDLALPQSYREPVWLDYDHLFGYSSTDKSIHLVSVTEDVTDFIYSLPERPIECRLSPDGRLLAVAFQTASGNRKADLILIDVNKKTLVYHASSFAQPYVTPAGLPAVNLTWSSADTLLYVDGDDIVRAYLSPDGRIMDRKNTIEKDSHILDYYAEENLLLYKPLKASDSLYLMQDNKSRRLRDISADGDDFYCVLVDGETILFQKGEEIFRYSIAEQTAELIGSGLLLGVSAGRDKAYYMINAEDYSRSAP